MIIKSYPKINLTLKILSKYLNGLHNIQSNALLLNHFDEIVVKRHSGNKDVIKFKGRFVKDINLIDNSIYKTLNLLRSLNLTKNFYKITVKKKIPTFSGLGGGTSNSFFLANKILNGKINKKLNQLLQKEIGSDFNLFKYKKTFQKDLYNFQECKIKIKIYFLLIYPNIKCSTREIYSMAKNFNSKKELNFSNIRSEHHYLKLIEKGKNDLQEIVEKKHPKIKSIIKDLKVLNGCIVSRMTGSGSVCFGLFKSKNLAKKGLKEIKKRYPMYWSVITKPI